MPPQIPTPKELLEMYPRAEVKDMIDFMKPIEAFFRIHVTVTETMHKMVAAPTEILKAVDEIIEKMER